MSRPLLLAVCCALAGPGGGSLVAQVVVPPRPPPPPPPPPVVRPPVVVPRPPQVTSPPPVHIVPSGTVRSGTARTISTAAGRAPDQPARPPATPDPGIGPVTTVLGIGLFVVAGGVVVGWVASRKRQVVLIRIIGVPPGEAPDEVRAAWVGVELPLAPGEREPVNLPGLGVVSGEPTPAVGYVVDGPTAVDRLAAHNPGAAQWWRANAPQVLEPGATLVFAAEVCERVG